MNIQQVNWIGTRDVHVKDDAIEQMRVQHRQLDK